MLIAIYDYLGYYNICHLGDEVRNPGRTIPRAVILSVVVVVAIYMTMNLAIIGVVPWREAMESENIAATFMERLFGRKVAVAFTALIVWTALRQRVRRRRWATRASRYAAARAGDFFPVFGQAAPARATTRGCRCSRCPALTAVFCFFYARPGDQRGRVGAHPRSVRRADRRAAPPAHAPGRTCRCRSGCGSTRCPSLVALVGWLFVWATSAWHVLASGLGGAGARVSWSLRLAGVSVGGKQNGGGRDEDCSTYDRAVDGMSVGMPRAWSNPARSCRSCRASSSSPKGPAADAEGNVYFTDQPNDRIMRLGHRREADDVHAAVRAVERVVL